MPTAASRSTRLPQPVLASLRWPAGPNCRPATRRGPTWSQHPFGDFALFVGEVAGEDGAPRARSRSGSTAPSSRAASARWPRRCRWTCAPTTRAWLQLKLERWRRSPRSAPFEMPFPPHGERAPVPRRRRGDRGGDPLALRAARRAAAAARRGHAGDRRDVQPRRAAAPAPTARWPGRSTSTTRPPASTFTLTLKEVDAARRPTAAPSRGRARSASRATTRARSTAWRGCCRWTCA